MADEPSRTARPRTDWPEQIRAMVDIWQGMAEASAHVAAAKRTIFIAYVAEGFTEAQALELVKTL